MGDNQGSVKNKAITTEKEVLSKVTSDVLTIGKYKKMHFHKELSRKILNRLQDVMDNEKPYLDNNLTLPQLAKMVATSSNNLSQVINEQLSMNFFD